MIRGRVARTAGSLALTLVSLLAGSASGQEPEAAARAAGATEAAATEAAALRALWAGRPAEAAARLREAVAASGGTPAERTGWIELLAVLEVADSAEAAVVGRALGGLRRDPGDGGADVLLADLARVPAGEGRPALLALAARGLDAAGRPAEAVSLRRHLVARHPDSAEAPVAMLELGRALRGEDPGRRGAGWSACWWSIPPARRARWPGGSWRR